MMVINLLDDILDWIADRIIDLILWIHPWRPSKEQIEQVRKDLHLDGDGQQTQKR